jgi:urease subunit gamma/beta
MFDADAWQTRRVRLLPHERERLEIFQAAELARRRRGRGLRLSQAEAVALISDEVLEAARDGLGYEQVELRGYEVLGPEDVLDGVPPLVPRIELEPLFADGHRLIVLLDPIGAEEPPPLAEGDGEIPWLESEAVLEIANEGEVPVGLSSHFHLFEANRALRFDRRAAWGMRLALAAGEKVTIEPGATLKVRLASIGGERVVRGHGELLDGPLDRPGALEAALERARERGYRGA